MATRLGTMKPFHAAMANALAATKPQPEERWQLLQWIQDLRVVCSVLAAQDGDSFDAEHFLEACGWQGTEHT